MFGEEVVCEPVDPDERVQLHNPGDVAGLEPGHFCCDKKKANQAPSILHLAKKRFESRSGVLQPKQKKNFLDP